MSKLKSTMDKEMTEAASQFDQFDQSVKNLTMDMMNTAPKEETEPQSKVAQKDRDKQKDIYLKPHKSIGSREKFNEKYRDDYTFSREYVHFEAENKEIIGETIDMWTKPFPGCDAEEWKVPVNVPLWAPRHVAEQIQRKGYHILEMENKVNESSQFGTIYGSMAVKKTVQRLEARPVSTKRSIFMGA